MAPTATATESITRAFPTLSLRAEGREQPSEGAQINRGRTTSVKPRWWSELDEAEKSGKPYPYEAYLPTFDPTLKLEPLTDFEHVDPGHQALSDAEPRSFLANATIEDLTPDFGSEVEGIQLSQLDARGRQQLALYVAQRGVVAFRDQDFVDQGGEWIIHDWTKFFGRPHIHPVSGQPKDYPELHLVYRSPTKNFNYQTDTKLSSSAWHSDVTYEKQPPGLTGLWLYDSPPSGGDTGYADQRAAYQKLSVPFREYLETLSVLHSGVAQANHARGGGRGGIVKREPVENIHPLIRTHPVTGEKALFVNRQFSRKIIGLKEEESDAILELLYNHIEKGAEFQTRVRWRPRTVVLWDNRITAHTAIADFGNTPHRRHGARSTPQAEAPFFRKE